MNITDTPACNDILRAAPGTEDSVAHLPIQRVEYANGEQAVRSFWMPTPDELRELIAGKPVCIAITGHTHPPILLTVGDGTEDLSRIALN